MRKIKLNPTRWQKMVLQEFNRHCRFTYNAIVAARHEDRAKHKLNFQALRNAFVTEKSTARDNEVDKKSRKPKLDPNGKKVCTTNPFTAQNAFLKYTPVTVRQGAVKQYVAAEKAAFENKRQGHVSHFKMKFRSKKREHTWTVHIDKRQIRFADGRLVILSESLCSENSTYKPGEAARDKLFRRPRKQPQKQLPDETHVRFFEKPPFVGHPQFDCSIHYSWGTYYLQVPIERKIQQRPMHKALQPVLGVDPGIRDFMTFCDSVGTGRFVGKHEVDRLVAIENRLSAIQSHLKHASDTQLRLRLARQRRIAKRQYYDYKTNFHHQTASWMAKNHSAIFLPEWNIEAWKRSLKAKAVRRLQISGAGLFMQRLRQHCFERGTWLPVVDENYTTQTCCKCGFLHRDIRDSKEFACPACKHVADRDMNSAINMLLKHTTFCQIRPAASADACSQEPGWRHTWIFGCA